MKRRRLGEGDRDRRKTKRRSGYRETNKVGNPGLGFARAAAAAAGG